MRRSDDLNTTPILAEVPALDMVLATKHGYLGSLLSI
jgi:hypothetical protein